MHLASIGFGSPEFDEKDGAIVEAIQHKAWIAGMYESFTEAGPQFVILLVTIICTGRITCAQYFSIPSSLFSLSWASSRAYFMQREEDYSDPDPEAKTVLFGIFPNNLVVALNNAILWTPAHMCPEHATREKILCMVIFLYFRAQIVCRIGFQEIKIRISEVFEKIGFFSLFLTRKRLSRGQKWFLRPYFPLIMGMFEFKSGLRFLFQALEVSQLRVRKRSF